MKQNFLLKSFVLLIALLAGGISASAQDGTYVPQGLKTITAYQVVYCTDITSAGNAASDWVVVPQYGTDNRSYTNTNEDAVGNPNKINDVIESTTSSVAMIQIKKDGNTLSDPKRVIHMHVKGIIGVIAHGFTGSANRGMSISCTEYVSGSTSTMAAASGTVKRTSAGSMICQATGLDATKEYIVSIYAVDGDTRFYCAEFIVPASGKDPSAFALTSETAVTLWKGETSTITYSDAAGTVTFESSKTDVATVDADGVITAVAEGTAVITVTDPGSETVDGATKTINVTVNEHKNTTTSNVAGETGANVILDNNSFNETLSNSALGKDLTYGDGPLFSITDSSDKNFQNGSGNYMMTIGNNSYMPFKIAGSRTIQLVPGEGVEITSAKVYVEMNSNSAGTLTDPNDPSVSITIPGRTATADVTTDAVAVYDITEYLQFKVSGQAIVCFDITYNTTQQMSVTIKETGYATLYTDYAVTIPEGVEAFTGKYNATTQTVQLTPVTTTIPKETAVILHTETPGTYSFVAAEDVAAIDNNDLVGTLVVKTVAAQSVYTLGLGGADNTVGMRLYNGTTIRAYSAYMEAPANAAPFFNLGYGDEGTTGIRSIDNGQLTIDNVYYDLAGRRVAQPSKGVYIVNGKKVVIK